MKKKNKRASKQQSQEQLPPGAKQARAEMLRNLSQRQHRIPNKTMKAFLNMGVGNHVLTAVIRKEHKHVAN